VADPVSQLEAGLKEGLAEVIGNETLVALLDRRPEAELFEVGRRAVQLAVSPLIWSERLGPLLDTSQVCERLGVTRQAVAKAVGSGRALAIPVGKSRRFPAWQFSFGHEVAVRPEVAEVLGAFRSVYPDVRPLQVASWAMTPQPELDGSPPARWLEDARPLEPVLVSARRTAAALAQ
jgi:hypothetical protein